jgi:ankyrin repeat protein
LKALIRYGEVPEIYFPEGGFDMYKMILTITAFIFVISFSCVSVSPKERGKMLILAVQENNIKAVKKLIKKGADINSMDAYGRTALMYAVIRSNIDIVKELVMYYGTDLNVRDTDGRTALILCSWLEDEKGSEIADRLIKADAELDIADNNKMTALMWAVYEGKENTAKVLIDAGANFDLTDENGQTALIYASWKGYGEIALMLVNAGTDTTIMDDEGKTAYMLAEEKEHPDIAEIIKNQEMAAGKEEDVAVTESDEDKEGENKSEEGVPDMFLSLSARSTASGSVELQWIDNSQNEDGFVIQRREGGGNWEIIHETEADITSWTDTDVKEGTDYFYMVASYNAAGISAWSEEVVASIEGESEEKDRVRIALEKEKLDQLEVHFKGIEKDARYQQQLGGWGLIIGGALSGVFGFSCSSVEDDYFGIFNLFGTMFLIAGGIYAGLGCLILVIPNEFITIPQEFYILPENTDEQVKRKVSKGETYLKNIAEKGKTGRYINGVSMILFGLISIAFTSQYSDRGVYIISCVTLAGAGLFSFLIKSKAEIAYEEYRNWKVRRKITATAVPSWYIDVRPSHRDVAVTLHLPY